MITRHELRTGFESLMPLPSGIYWNELGQGYMPLEAHEGDVNLMKAVLRINEMFMFFVAGASLCAQAQKKTA